ncbi:MAG: amidohydrolase family protein [Proteobacteria bacterium]|nr:amidohydrolase family protein [Pseudomonadota bacterium]
MFTDTHCHVFHPKIAEKALAQLEGHYGIKPRGTGVLDDLLARADRAGISRMVVHTAATDHSQVIPANNWALDLMRQSQRITAFGTLHPDYADPDRELDRLARAGVVGLKFHPDFQGFFLDDPRFYALMERIGSRFLLMFHVGDTRPPAQNPSCPMKLARLRRAFPGPVMIAAHLGGYLHWEWAVEHLAGLDVYMDTSSSLRVIRDETLRQLLKRHPAERLLFGSDYPLFDPGDEMALIRQRLEPLGLRLADLLAAGSALFPARGGGAEN